MATAAYWNWVSDGRPWKIARPVLAVGDVLKGHGYVVYYLGSDDVSHLQADTPEDHCPFSRTGWPGKNPYPYVNAFDIMPPKPGQVSKLDGKPLPSLQQLGRQMIADKNDGVPGMKWLKYMNWESRQDWDGPCWNESWQPDHERWPSEDRGHIHGSGRSDYVDSHVADGYDLVARVRNPEATAPRIDPAVPLEEENMVIIVHPNGSGYWASPKGLIWIDGVERRSIDGPVTTVPVDAATWETIKSAYGVVAQAKT